MKECVKCGIQYEDFFTFCRKCGGPLLTIQDSTIGNETEDTSRQKDDVRAPQSSPTQDEETARQCTLCGTFNLIDTYFCKKCGQPFQETVEEEKASKTEEGKASSGPDDSSNQPETNESAVSDAPSQPQPLPKPYLVRNIVIGASIAICVAIIIYILLPTGQAEISVSTKPSAAYLIIDKQARGQTPTAGIILNSGSHHIIIEKDGYLAEELDFSLKPREKKNLVISLKRDMSSSGKGIVKSPGETPEPANKPAPGGSDSEVLGFIEQYFKDTSNKNIDLILSHYGEEVDYFSKGIVDKRFIKKDKELYLRRWTAIKYTIEGQPETRDGSKVNSKIVKFNSTFLVSSAKQTITGTAENTWTLEKINNEWRIVREKQRVLNREKN